MRAIVNSSIDGLVLVDHHGHIAEFNPAAEHIFGYTRAQAIGRDIATLIIGVELHEHRWSGFGQGLENGESPISSSRHWAASTNAAGIVLTRRAGAHTHC